MLYFLQTKLVWLKKKFSKYSFRIRKINVKIGNFVFINLTSKTKNYIKEIKFSLIVKKNRIQISCSLIDKINVIKKKFRSENINFGFVREVNGKIKLRILYNFQFTNLKSNTKKRKKNPIKFPPRKIQTFRFSRGIHSSNRVFQLVEKSLV